MGLDNSKWVEIDKRQCFIDIIDGVLDLWEEEVRVVGLLDEGWIEPLNDVSIETMRFLLEEDEIKLFKKVVDTE